MADEMEKRIADIKQRIKLMKAKLSIDEGNTTPVSKPEVNTSNADALKAKLLGKRV
jgi:hypothetical protein